MTTERIKILHEGESWERLQIERRLETWEVSQCLDGDVEISCDGSDGTTCLFLSQDELKQVIAFLQKQVK